MTPDKGLLNAARRWLPAIAAGAVVAALVLALFRAPSPQPAGQPARPLSPVRLVRPEENGADPLASGDLAGYAALHDPTPLFLPTHWTSAQKDNPAPPPEGSFKGYAPRLEFAEDNLALGLAPAGPPSRPAEALQTSPLGSNPLVGFGRTDAPVPALESRLAFVSVAEARSGAIALTESLHDAPNVPPGLRNGDWAPLEFMAAVDSAGLVRPLVLTQRTGTAADSFFLDYLSRDYRIGDRLAPGFYRISVGP